MNFCPCLQGILSKFTGKKQKPSYEGPREFQQEEFMNPHQEEPLSDTITPPRRHEQHKQKQQKTSQITPTVSKKQQLLPTYEQEKEPEAEILNIKMEIADTKVEVKSSTTVAEQKEEEKSIEQLIQAQLLLTPSQVIKQSVIEREQIKLVHEQCLQESSGEPNFIVNLDTLDPHFALIHEKATLVPEFLKREGQRLEIGAPNKTGLQIMLIEHPKAACFILHYTLRCPYSFYLSVMRNEKALTNLGGILAEAKTLQSYRANLTLNTLKFKRLGGLQPRDCFYVKYQNSGKNHHWELYLNDETAPRTAQYKTCEIFCCKSLKQNGQKELRISEYLQVDLGAANLSSVVPKLAVQMRNFLNFLSEHLDHNYDQQLA